MFIKSIENRFKKEGIAFDTSRISVDVSGDDVFVVIDSEEYYEYQFKSNRCKTTKMWSRKHNWRGLRVKYFTDFVVKIVRDLRSQRNADLVYEEYCAMGLGKSTVSDGTGLSTTIGSSCVLDSMSEDELNDFIEDLFG